MNIIEMPEGDAVTLKIEGVVDSYSSDDFIEAVTSACENYKKVRIDLNGVPYFSSSGIRGLIMGQKITKVNQGELELFGLNDTLRNILDTMGLTESFTIK